jgi:hypothetical protein
MITMGTLETEENDYWNENQKDTPMLRSRYR